jgi:hypothetical protein
VGIGPAEKLLAACEMHEEGMDILRQRLRRQHPDASQDEIESMVAEWVADRPYDSPGRVLEP